MCIAEKDKETESEGELKYLLWKQQAKNGKFAFFQIFKYSNLPYLNRKIWLE